MGGDRYTIITADSHAGGSHAQYREYLESKYHKAFDAWRAKYKNPYKDLAPGDDRRLRNWDNEMRNRQQDEDGVVGEVIFPNTVPPFFPGFVLFAPPPGPEDYELRLAGIRAHNRWLVDFCNEYPERRAGIAQVFLNDVDDAIADATFAKENGLRGGILVQPVPPDVHDHIRPLNDPEYDRLWAVCQDLDIPVNAHGGVGSPSYPPFKSSTILHIQELTFYTRRPLVWMVLSGVFERFPGLKYVLTEAGGGWLKAFGKQLDDLIKNVKAGSQGELRFTEDMAPPRLASEYIYENIYLGVSMPSRYDVEHRDVVADGHWMWGSDYPHDEGTHPFTKECIQVAFQGVPTEEKRKLLADNCAALYDFDMKAMDRAAAKVGPLVSEIDAPLTSMPPNPNMALARAGSGELESRRMMD